MFCFIYIGTSFRVNNLCLMCISKKQLEALLPQATEMNQEGVIINLTNIFLNTLDKPIVVLNKNHSNTQIRGEGK